MGKRILFIVYVCCLSAGLFAQTQRSAVRGTVTDNSGEPVMGANVLIKGTHYGSSTDTNGNFNIKNVPHGAHILVVSTIGFQTREISLSVTSGMGPVDVELRESVSQLQEITLSGSKKDNYSRETVSPSLRMNQQISKMPQNVQVVPEELLTDQQSFTMMDAITRNVSGAQMVEHWGWFARVNMRGFRLPAFRNGMNVEMTWGPLSEDLSMVEQIEFVKGPAGFMMAAGQPGGFYNVVTKKPKKETFAHVSFTTGSYDTYRGTVDVGSYAGDGKLQYRVNAMAQSANSHRDYEPSSRFSVVPSLRYEITKNSILTQEFTYQKAKMKAGAAYVFAPVDVGFGGLDRDFATIDPAYPTMNVEEYNTTTNFTQKLGDRWTFQAQYMYMQYEQEGATLWPASIADNGDLIRSVTSADALGTYNIFQAFVNGDFNTGAVKHKVLAGFDFNEKQFWADWNQGGAIDTPENPFNIFDPHYGDVTMPVFDRSVNIKTRGLPNALGQTIRAYYAQDELNFMDERLRVTLAGRYTQADVYAYGVYYDASKFTPRFGLSFDITPSLTVYGLYDQSFFPQQGARYIDEDTAAPLDPEDSHDIEGGLKKSWFDGRLKTSLTAYRMKKKNLAVTDYENGVPTDGGGISYPYSVQIGEAVSKGIEFDASGQLTPELNLVFNYAYTNVEDGDGNKIAGFSEHITNGWLNYSFNEYSVLHGFGASLGYQYQVNRSSWNWGADNTSDLPDYFRMDGGIFWRNSNIDIRLNVNNLLNKYLYSGANYGSYMYWQSEPGRNFRLSIAYKF